MADKRLIGLYSKKRFGRCGRRTVGRSDYRPMSSDSYLDALQRLLEGVFPFGGHRGREGRKTCPQGLYIAKNGARKRYSGMAGAPLGVGASGGHPRIALGAPDEERSGVFFRWRATAVVNGG